MRVEDQIDVDRKGTFSSSATTATHHGAANPVGKVTAVLAGLLTGADYIDDLDGLRSGGMKRAFGGVFAAAALGIFQREFTHSRVRQLHALLL